MLLSQTALTEYSSVKGNWGKIIVKELSKFFSTPDMKNRVGMISKQA